MGWLSGLFNATEHASRNFYGGIMPRSFDDVNWADVFLGMGVTGPLKFVSDQWRYGMENLFPQPEEPQKAIEVNHQSNTWKRPVIYGTRGRVGGNQAFLGAAGANNEYFYILLDICEGEIEAIDDVYISGTISTDSKFSGLVTITKHTGTEDQAADSTLSADFPSLWNSSRQLKGVAYVVVKLKYDTTAFSGLPDITCDIRGKKVYDPRTTTTYFSNTPALCFYDYILNPIYGKGEILGEVDEDYISAAATYHETAVTKHNNTTDTFPLLTCDVVLDTNNKIVDNVNLLLLACRAGFPRINGKHCLVVKKDEASIFDFNQSNIIGGWKFSGGDLRSKFNDAEVKYSNSDTDWKDDTLPVTSVALFAEDNNSTLSTAISAPWIIDKYHATDLANLAIKESRQQIAVSFVASPAALKVVTGSIVTVTHPTPGWEEKTFRVAELTLISDALVAVSLVEHEAAVYDRDVPVEYTPPPDTNLPDPDNVLPPTDLQLFSGDDELLLAGDGTVITRIHGTWTAPVGYPYVVGYDVEFKKSDDTVWIPTAPVRATDGEDVWISPVDDGDYYDVHVRTVGPDGKVSSWVAVQWHQVVGKTAPPPDVATFLVDRQPDGTRVFTWTLADDAPADLAGYKIKYKLSASQPWSSLLPLHAGLLNASPFESNQLAAGTYTVGIVAVDTSGNESANPLLIDSTLGDPRITGSVFSVDVGNTYPYWDGSFTSCHAESDNIVYPDNAGTWADLSGTTWADWTSYANSPAEDFSFEYGPIDLGVILAFIPLVSVEGNGTMTVEEKHSDDDVTYTSYTAIGPQIITRYVYLKVSCNNTVDLGYISRMVVNLSAKTIEEYGNDLVTSTISSPAGTLRLPLSKTYSKITDVGLVLQIAGGGGPWWWKLGDRDEVNGPLVYIYNNTTLADCTIDYRIRGV